MRAEVYKNRQHDPRIIYRGENPSRFENLTDGVFGIAITLLIFNLANPNTFESLLAFTQTLPAFLLSISFLMIIWNEHVRFTEIYTLNDTKLIFLNTLFIGLIIFYVYPLRFLTLFLTNFFFNTEIQVRIDGNQVPLLMIYYGFVAFALYFTLYMFYLRAYNIRADLRLNAFEEFYTRHQKIRMAIMFSVTIVSIVVTWLLSYYSYALASMIGGLVYCAYSPAIMIWYRKYKKEEKQYQ